MLVVYREFKQKHEKKLNSFTSHADVKSHKKTEKKCAIIKTRTKFV